MKPIWIGIVSTVFLPFAFSGVAAFIDNQCFADLRGDNDTYATLMAARFGLSLTLSVLTGCLAGCWAAGRLRLASLAALISGCLMTAFLLWSLKCNYEMDADIVNDASASFRLRYEFYVMGDYLIWAVALTLIGAALLSLSGRKRVAPEAPVFPETTWPPPPKQP